MALQVVRENAPSPIADELQHVYHCLSVAPLGRSERSSSCADERCGCGGRRGMYCCLGAVSDVVVLVLLQGLRILQTIICACILSFINREPDDDGAEGRCFSAGVLLREPSQRICPDTRTREQSSSCADKQCGCGGRRGKHCCIDAACDVVVLVLLQGLKNAPKQFSGHASSPSSTDNCNL